MRTNTMVHIREILARLHLGGFPEAIVAGGAIRDWDNDREAMIKDIDVFVKDRPGYLRDLKAAFPDYTHVLKVTEEVARYMEFESVVCVQEFHKDDCLPIQVVVMNRDIIPDAIIDRHDFGLCQIAYDGLTVFKSHHYDYDKTNRTFTLIRCRNPKDYWRSMKRWSRLEPKFPGWRLIA